MVVTFLDEPTQLVLLRGETDRDPSRSAMTLVGGFNDLSQLQKIRIRYLWSPLNLLRC